MYFQSENAVFKFLRWTDLKFYQQKEIHYMNSRFIESDWFILVSGPPGCLTRTTMSTLTIYNQYLKIQMAEIYWS